MPENTARVGTGASLTQATNTQIQAITNHVCGPSNVNPPPYFSLLEAFCRMKAVPNALGQFNAACMVSIESGRQAGTVVTMDANFRMDQNRPTTGFRIDLQHYNSQNPDQRSRNCANFQVQTNGQNPLSLAEVHMPPDVQWTPAIVIAAFTESLTHKRAVQIYKT